MVPSVNFYTQMMRDQIIIKRFVSFIKMGFVSMVNNV